MLFEEFRLWATKLGCPPECIPCEDALKSVYKTRQNELFVNLMQRVQSRQDVKEIRENILINQLERVQQPVVYGHNFLPAQLQIYLKKNALLKKKTELKAKLDGYRKEYDILADSIKMKNLQRKSLEHKQNLLQDKVHILSSKADALDTDIKKEQKNRELITATIPVGLTVKNASEKDVIQAVEEALNELQHFYDFSNKTNDPQLIQEATNKLWQQMRTIFSNKPNFLIFKTIMRHKTDHLEAVTALKQSQFNEQHISSFSGIVNAGGVGKEPLTAFETESMKLKASLLCLVSQYLTAHQERLLLEESFSIAYEPFVCEVQRKLEFFNPDCFEDDHSDQIISNFMIQYNSLNFSKAQNSYFAEQIDLYTLKLETGNQQLENHQVLLSSLGQLYFDINTTINRMHFEMVQLGQVKDKISYSKNIMQCMLNDLQTTASMNSKSLLMPTNMKTNVNISPTGSESFMLSGDNVFCSTKFDLDTTGNISLNNTIMRRNLSSADNTLLPTTGGGNMALPTHLTELNCFADTSLEYFSCMSPACAFYYGTNPLVMEYRALYFNILRAPGVLLTPYGAMRELLVHSANTNMIAAYTEDLKSNIDSVTVEPHEFKQRMKQQQEHIMETLDRINMCCDNTRYDLEKLKKLHNFQLANPLRHYIPPTKCFNNQNYTDYEAEFQMYYRMATARLAFK